MAEEKDQKAETLPFAKAKRERKVVRLSERVRELEHALDCLLSEYEPTFYLYVSYYRRRYGCDPDTGDVPLDYLFTGGEEDSE